MALNFLFQLSKFSTLIVFRNNLLTFYLRIFAFTIFRYFMCDSTYICSYKGVKTRILAKFWGHEVVKNLYRDQISANSTKLRFQKKKNFYERLCEIGRRISWWQELAAGIWCVKTCGNVKRVENGRIVKQQFRIGT